MILYAILLRIASNARQRLRKKQFEIWENLLLRYLSREASTQEIRRAVKAKHFSLFAEFMEKYLEVLRGEDFESLKHLLKKVGLFEYTLSMLNSRNMWDRVYAAFFLGLMRNKEAVPYLQKGVEDKHHLVSFASAIALAKTGEKLNLVEMLSFLAKRDDLESDKAMEVLLESGRGIGDELSLLLDREDIRKKWKYLIIDLLGYWQHLKSGPRLLRLLNTSKDNEMKIRCIRSLGELSCIESTPDLAAHLEDENWPIRSEAAKALGKIGASEYSGKIAASLSDKNWWVRYSASKALANFGEEGMTLLRKMAREERDSDARRICTHVLSEIKLLARKET